jgi:hypothetical protein
MTITDLQPTLEVGGASNFTPFFGITGSKKIGKMSVIPLPLPTNGLSDALRSKYAGEYPHPVGYYQAWMPYPFRILNKALYPELTAEQESLYDSLVKGLKELKDKEYLLFSALFDKQKEASSYSKMSEGDKKVCDSLRSAKDSGDFRNVPTPYYEIWKYLIPTNGGKFANYTFKWETSTILYCFVGGDDRTPGNEEQTINGVNDIKDKVACIMFNNSMSTDSNTGKDMTLWNSAIGKAFSLAKSTTYKKNPNVLDDLFNEETKDRKLRLLIDFSYNNTTPVLTLTFADCDPAVSIPDDALRQYQATNWLQDITRCSAIFDEASFTKAYKRVSDRLGYFAGRLPANSAAASVAQPQQVPAAPVQQTPPPAPQEAAASEPNDGLPF